MSVRYLIGEPGIYLVPVVGTASARVWTVTTYYCMVVSGQQVYPLLRAGCRSRFAPVACSTAAVRSENHRSTACTPRSSRRENIAPMPRTHWLLAFSLRGKKSMSPLLLCRQATRTAVLPWVAYVFIVEFQLIQQPAPEKPTVLGLGTP